MKKIAVKTITLVLITALLAVPMSGCSKKNKTEGDKVAEQKKDQNEKNIDAAGEEDNAEEPINTAAAVVGGWNADIAQGAALPEEVETRFRKAIEGLDGVMYEPIAYLGSQVVAGANYAILCRCSAVVPNPVPTLKVVVVYADLQGGAELLSVKDFSVAAFNTGESHSTSAEIIPGGWMASSEPACELPEGSAEAFNDSIGMLNGSKIEPLALVGSQVVAGTNYAYLCRITPVVPDAVSQLAVIIVYRNLSGESVVSSIETFSIADYR